MDAVIFDMDGTLIDSEPMWKLAEREVFGSLGVDVDDYRSGQTASMTTTEVCEFWHHHNPWSEKTLQQAEQDVIDQVAYLMKTQGKAMPGALALLTELQQQQIPIGLATNSPRPLIDVVFDRLDIHDYFASTACVDDVHEAKPHPAIYQYALKQLGASASQSVAIEDSIVGMTSAIAAGMKVVVIPATHNYQETAFHHADAKLTSMAELDYATLIQLSECDLV